MSSSKEKALISLIGNAPSSGSTFFADLLDSSHISACGNELNIFSNRKFYNYCNFKRNPWSKSISSIYLKREGINTNVLHHYGLNKFEIEKLLNMSESPLNFSQNFSKRYLALRGKVTTGVTFEKTPQNILCIGEFLKACPESYFIFLLRNPLHVYVSLRNRGFSQYMSLVTWYLEILKYLTYKNHPRVLLIRYEDLISFPYEVTGSLIERVSGIMVDPSMLESSFSTNEYRKIFSIRLESWKTKKVGLVVDCNEKKIPKNYREEFNSLFSLTINKSYARLFDLADISAIDAVNELGYDQVIPSQNGTMPPIIKMKKDFRRLLLRFLLAISTRDANPTSLYAYLNPVLTI